MPIRVLINGAFGNMGQLSVRSLAHSPDFTVVGETGRGSDLLSSIKDSRAEVVVDFTNAESVYQNALTIIESGAHPVIGTTGLLKDDIVKLQERCNAKQLGGIIAPNFALGVILMMKCAQLIAPYFSDVEIIEMHHNRKMDSPSGTAIRTAEILATTRQDTPEKPKQTRETVTGARGAEYQNIHIHAVRLPGLMAHQQVIFGGTGETLTIRHDSLDRQSFMPGLMLACKKVTKLKQMVYGLDQIL